MNLGTNRQYRLHPVGGKWYFAYYGLPVYAGRILTGDERKIASTVLYFKAVPLDSEKPS